MRQLTYQLELLHVADQKGPVPLSVPQFSLLWILCCAPFFSSHMQCWQVLWTQSGGNCKRNDSLNTDQALNTY